MLIRHFPMGFRYGKFPLLVRAPQRLLRFMGKLLCMGLFLWICFTPGPGGLDHFHNCLASGVHMNVLDRDLLLSLPGKHRAATPACDALRI
jgi:hypothetical protein